MLPYGRQSIDESDIEAVAAVMRSDWLTTGPAVTAFEGDLARIFGVSPVVSVSSGTAALHVAYAAMGVGAGDEVITTPLTFIATASCASLLGATVVFADISEDTGNLDPNAVSAAMTNRTKVVAGVDYAGHPIDVTALAEIAHAGGALLLEDAAHSIGGSLDGQPVGSLADVTTFSFFPTKNLTTAEGGAVVSLHDDVIDRAVRFRSIGLVRDPAMLRSPDEGPWHQEVHAFGLNYRLPDLLCVLGSSQLPRLPAFKARRDAITARYNAGLAGIDELRLPSCREGADPMWHLYPLRIRDGRRRALFEHLRANDIGAQVNYLPVYRHPVYADLGYRPGMCPVAEEYYAQEISLPLFPTLTDVDVDRVIALIRGFVGA
ncbi:MAG: aminotransferase class V-fold PLP-dependent enzyme [Phycicoccus sp.]|nr:aminotransferase class V-fold PLP-dependent enzyme [Phycicoccus sp.]NMM32692.1 aminotransferase class V-fold PLP-dependent enzyme [Phycicoccus sp.]